MMMIWGWDGDGRGVVKFKKILFFLFTCLFMSVSVCLSVCGWEVLAFFVIGFMK